MELFDSHCHIQSAGKSFGERTTHGRWTKAGVTPDGILERARQAGVTGLICVGCDLEDSQLAVSFVQQQTGTWAAVGIHPHEAHTFAADAAQADAFKELLKQPKVVAVGECGLDYFYEYSPKAAQIAVLKFQIEQALKHDIPLIFHVREAFADFWPIFDSYHTAERPVRGVLHSFTDSKAHLDSAIQRGLFIGVNGIATFTKDLAQQAMYQAIPLAYLLLETDAPFLTPYPDRGKICEPYHVRITAEFLARQRNESVDGLAEATTRNAHQLFSV